MNVRSNAAVTVAGDAASLHSMERGASKSNKPARAVGTVTVEAGSSGAGVGAGEGEGGGGRELLCALAYGSTKVPFSTASTCSCGTVTL